MPEPRGTGSLRDELRALRAEGFDPPPEETPIPSPLMGQPASGEAPSTGEGSLSTLADAFRGVERGVGKGIDERIFQLGRLVHNTPIVGDITDALAKLLGPEGTDPNAAFAQTPPELASSGQAESAGKTLEELAEFFTPAGAARRAGVYGATRMLPNLSTASRGARMVRGAKGPVMAGSKSSPMSIANKIAAIVGRSAGEAGSAGSVAALHGDENPEYAAALGAAGPAVGSAIGSTANVLKSPLAQRLAAFTSGASTARLLKQQGGATGLGAFGLTRSIALHLLKDPRVVPFLQRQAQQGFTGAGRLLAALESVALTPDEASK